MLARIAILVAFFSFLNDASAQFVNTYAGSPLGSILAQQCPYNFQQAPQLQMSPEQQRMEAMREGEKEERLALKSIDAEMAKLTSQIRKAERGIRMRLTPEAARIVLKHMKERGDGAGLVMCEEAAPPRVYRRADPGPMDTITAPRPTPVPENQQEQEVPVQDPQSTSDNRAIDKDRMPADENTSQQAAAAPAATTTSGAATPPAPVAAKPANSPNEKGDPALTGVKAPVASESDAAAPQGPPPQAETYDLPSDHYSKGGVFCIRGRNMWEQYALPDGDVDPSICEQMIGFDRSHLANIQRAGRTSESVAACQDSIDRLKELYARLADLDSDRAMHVGNADQYRVEADPTYSVRARSPRIAGGLRGNIHAFIAPLSQVVGNNYGGYPYQPSTPFFFANYGAGGYNGLASTPYNGYYGTNPGGIGPGGYGCNGVQNPLLQNPLLNSVIPPWANGVGPWGAPQVPQYRPMPNFPQARVAPIPYLNSAGGGFPGNPRFAPLPGVSNIAGGGIAPGALPLGGTLAGQLGVLNAGVNNWGAGVVPNLVSGSYYGAGVGGYGYGGGYTGGYGGVGYAGGYGGGYGAYQTSYLNTPSLAPSRLPYAP